MSDEQNSPPSEEEQEDRGVDIIETIGDAFSEQFSGLVAASKEDIKKHLEPISRHMALAIQEGDFKMTEELRAQLAGLTHLQELRIRHPQKLAIDSLIVSVFKVIGKVLV